MKRFDIKKLTDSLKNIDSEKLMKKLNYVSKTMMVLGAAAGLVGSIVDDKRHSLEVKKEVAEILKKGGS